MRKLVLALVAAALVIPALVPPVFSDDPVTLPDICYKCNPETRVCVEVDCPPSAP